MRLQRLAVALAKITSWASKPAFGEEVVAAPAAADGMVLAASPVAGVPEVL